LLARLAFGSARFANFFILSEAKNKVLAVGKVLIFWD
jgi:hypothetical protein